jgi:protein ImuA
MKLISADDGQLRAMPSAVLNRTAWPLLKTGLTALDALAPEGGFVRGAVHEFLSEDHDSSPRFVALALARVASEAGGTVVWSDPRADLYPPALAASGLALERMLFLQVADATQELRAISACLQCKGVALTVAAPRRLSRVEARRLQLAAESGGGLGVLLRQAGPASAHYAAATRWLVRPVRGIESVQQWSVELLHGHGGQVGKPVILEVCRDTNHVRVVETLADRSGETETIRMPA